MTDRKPLDSPLKARKMATHFSPSLHQLQMVPKGSKATGQPLTWSQHTGEFFSGKINNPHLKGSVLQITGP